jgi:hypothetical protein
VSPACGKVGIGYFAYGLEGHGSIIRSAFIPSDSPARCFDARQYGQQPPGVE